VLWLTRRRAARGKALLGGRATTAGAFMALLAGPTLLTMFVSGLWHGAGYLFVLWGLLHGLYLTINHAWRIFGSRLSGGRAVRAMSGVPAFLLTFVAVVVSMVLFRATTLAAAGSILRGMLGLNGIGLPPALFDRVAPLAARLHGVIHASTEMSATDMVGAMAWVAALLAGALLLPNTLQFLERYEPALSASRVTSAAGWLRRSLVWSPSPTWLAALSVLAFVAVLQIGGQSEFLYWAF